MGKNMHTVLLFKKEVDVNIYIFVYIRKNEKNKVTYKLGEGARMEAGFL